MLFLLAEISQSGRWQILMTVLHPPLSTPGLRKLDAAQPKGFVEPSVVRKASYKHSTEDAQQNSCLGNAVKAPSEGPHRVGEHLCHPRR